MYIILRSYQWENKSRNPIILQCPGTPIKLSTIQNIIFSSDKKQKKTTTLRAQPVDSDKNFFLKWNPPRLSHLSEVSSISRGGLYQAQATPGRQSPVSSAANSWHQVKGTKPARLEGELHPPPLPSVDYHTGVVGIKWSLATVIGPSNYVTNWP